MRDADGAWVGWARPGRPRARAVRLRRHPDRAGPAQRRRPRDLLRGLHQRHPLAAVPRRDRAARATTASGGTATSASTGGSRMRRPRVAAQGATVWVQDYQLQLVPRMLREARPDLTIGFFNHIPFPAYGIYSQLPWRTPDHRGPARRRRRSASSGSRMPATSPARCAACSATRPRARSSRCPHADGDRPAAWSPRPFPISIDVAAFEQLAAQPRGAGAGAADPRRPRQPEDRSCSASTGSTTPRASATG